MRLGIGKLSPAPSNNSAVVLQILGGSNILRFKRADAIKGALDAEPMATVLIAPAPLS
jgi:hypothetical protein